MFALIGGNGAGKTTVIKHILGMLKAHAGTVQVFGLDPVQNPVGTLGRIGYLSEEPDLPGWMRVGELFRYTQAFFPTWDETYAEELRQAFDLDAKEWIKMLSRGQRGCGPGCSSYAAHRPELLVLDEPSFGLDPVVRRDILGAIIRTIADEGRTVFFFLPPAGRDRAALPTAWRSSTRGGSCSHPQWMKSKTRIARVTLRFGQPVGRKPRRWSAAFQRAGEGAEWTYVCSGESAQLRSSRGN